MDVFWFFVFQWLFLFVSSCFCWWSTRSQLMVINNINAQRLSAAEVPKLMIDLMLMTTMVLGVMQATVMIGVKRKKMGQLKMFYELVEYCIQDVKEKNFKEVYGINTHRDIIKKRNYDYGIVFYVLNRLSFVVFHDLMYYENRKDNSFISRSDTALFPSLIKLFQFLYNYSVFVHCCSEGYGDSTQVEIFYVKQYHLLRYSLYDYENMEDEQEESKNTNNNDEIVSTKGNRKSIRTLAKYNGIDGTLLHSAVRADFYYYTTMLVHDEFDPLAQNRDPKQAISPMMIAKKRKLLKILSFLEATVRNSITTTSDTDSKEETIATDHDHDTTVGASVTMDEESLQDRYDAFMNQIMSVKYFLLRLGCKLSKTDKTCKIPHKSLEAQNSIDEGLINCKGYFSDDLYRPTSKLFGFRDTRWSVDGVYIMDSLVTCMVKYLKLKMPISQDLIILCCVYCIETGNEKLATMMLTVLNDTIRECLQRAENNVIINVCLVLYLCVFAVEMCSLAHFRSLRC